MPSRTSAAGAGKVDAMTTVDYASKLRIRHDVTRPERRASAKPAVTRPAVQFAAAAAALPLIVWLVSAGPGRSAWWTVVAALGVAALTTAVQARARSAAYRAGRAAERARCLRSLHDTALQSLETMALASDADRLAPAEALTQVRGIARRQAALLRRVLGELADGGGSAGAEPAGLGDRSLAESLADLITELPLDGPRVELVVGADAPRPAPWQHDCLRDATREALANVVKHAAARRIVVRVAGTDGGVEVVVRDDGRGFDPERTAPGFGTRQSITARIREAGGAVAIDSWPGRGTRVRLWMPSGLTTTRPRWSPRR